MTSLPLKKVQNDIYVGEPTTLSAKQSFNIHFCNFLSLPCKRRNFTLSPSFECNGNGYKWQLRLYPGGHTSSKEGDISLYLSSLNDEAVNAKFSFDIPKIGDGMKFDENTFAPKGATKGSYWGWRNFKKRKDIISSCLDDNGTLTVKVDIQVYTDKVCRWKPNQSLKNDMLQAFKSSEGTDISFLVEDQIVKAHRFILMIRAPFLAEIANSSSTVGTDMPIPNIKVDTFRSMLEFLYTDECPNIANKDDARAMLLAANKFGCQRLKIIVETELVDKYLNTDTAVELLLLADSNSCALLRESAMNLVVQDVASAKKSSDWIKIKESSDLLNEIKDEIIRNVVGETIDNNKDEEENVDKYSKLSVREILCKLEEKNLDVDGTRQMLLKRLREN